MTLNVTVISNDQASEVRWARALEAALAEVQGGGMDARIGLGTSAREALGEVVFIDAKVDALDRILGNVDRKGRAVFLIVREGDEPPAQFINGTVDDVLVFPFRALEVVGKLRHFQQVLMWDEVTKLNASFTDVIGRLKEDLKLAERLQKSKVPARFPDVKGFRIASRYLAGMRSGGDHFDLAESRDGHQLSIVLSDSSSYGLSSAVLSVLMKVAMKLSVEEARSCRETVKRIHEELALTLNEKDKLSLFYGIVSRRDYKLRYVNLGGSSAFLALPKADFKEVSSQGGPITQKAALAEGIESELTLLPESRLALVSDGIIECVGGHAKVMEILNKHRTGEAADCITELVYKVKEQFSEPDDMPAQDCTAVIFDVDARVMRMV